MVGVSVMVGVGVWVALGESVGVLVGVKVGLGVFVHMAAVAVFMVEAMVAWAAGEGLQAQTRMITSRIRNDLDCIIFGVFPFWDLKHGIPVRIVKPGSDSIIRRICLSRTVPGHFANLSVSG